MHLFSWWVLLCRCLPGSHTSFTALSLPSEFFLHGQKMGKTLLASVWPSKQNSAPSPPPPSEFFLDGLWCLAIPLASLSGCAELPYPLHRPHGVVPPVPPPPREHLRSFAVARQKKAFETKSKVMNNQKQKLGEQIPTLRINHPCFIHEVSRVFKTSVSSSFVNHGCLRHSSADIRNWGSSRSSSRMNFMASWDT